MLESDVQLRIAEWLLISETSAGVEANYVCKLSGTYPAPAFMFITLFLAQYSAIFD